MIIQNQTFLWMWLTCSTSEVGCEFCKVVVSHVTQYYISHIIIKFWRRFSWGWTWQIMLGNIFKMSFITAGVSCWSPSCISVKTDWPNDHSSYLTRSLLTKLLSCPNTHLALLFLLQSSKIIGQYGPHTRTVNYEIIQSKISMSKRETRTKGCRDLLTFMVVKLALTVSYDVWSWSSHFYNFWNLANISS